VDIKKPERYRGGRTRLNVPQRGDAPLVPRVPPQSSQPVNDVDQTTIRSILFTKKNIIISAGVLLVIIGLIITFSIIRQRDLARDARQNELSKSVQDLEYQTILPSGKSIDSLGGWKRVSPSKADPVYAYVDKIGDTPINVSEQPLPQSFIGDTDDNVAELAKQYNATTKIDANGIKVYIGSSAKGPQSVIFTKNSLLILIKSDQKIDDAAWVSYIKSLN